MLATPRVVHSVPQFLPLTENWIYPQVTAVPGVQSAVLCRNTANLCQFPLNGHPLFVQQSQLWCSASNRSIPKKAAQRVANNAAYYIAGLRTWRWRPSIVHAHFGMRGWESLALAKALGVPLITSFYGFDAWLVPAIHPEWDRRYKDLFLQGDLFLVEGSVFARRLVDLGCSSEKIRVNKLGVDLQNLMYRQRDFIGTLKVVMVGRFVEKKGLSDGLRACARACSQGADLAVTIIGDAQTGNPIEENIKRQLIRLASCKALSGRVHFTGFVTVQTLRDILNSNDILLCPSKHAKNGDAEGGYPVVLPESMGAGLLCIGSRHCDIPEVILDGRTGFLFDEGEISQLVNLLCDIAREPNRAIPLVQKARRHVEETFSLSRQLEKLAEIYVRLATHPEDSAIQSS
jgi:colanic acid/amylovoran biosynthesis glycosyltransferase